MAQQYSQPQHTYSPLPRTDSLHHAPTNQHPSIKRQPLSPNAQTPPYSSPSINNIALPNQVFSSPYYNTQTNGNSGNHTYNPYQQHGNAMTPSGNQNHNYGSQANNPYTPNTHYNPYTSNNSTTNNSNNNNAYSMINSSTPQSGPGVMGPPSRPAVDKPTDINELGDVIAGTGIDLREEEAALVNYNKGGQQRQDGGYGANLPHSFNSLGTNYTAPNYYSNNVAGDRNSFYGAGTFNQPAEPPKSTEEIEAKARKKALRRKAEIKSYHLNDPFLAPKLLLRLVGKLAQNNQVLVPTTGLIQNQSKPGALPRKVIVQGPDRNEVLKMVTTGDYLTTDSPYVEVLSLLSLATEERLRGLVEDAAALAKGRRTGSSGIVPIELSDLATGKGPSETVTGLPTPSNSAVSPTSNPLKRSYEDMNKPLSPALNAFEPAKQLVFTNPVPKTLNAVSQTERKWEEERLAKRQRRLTSESSRAGSVSLGASGAPGDIAPEIETKRGSKAKEQKDAAARKATEAQQHAATTKTMNMALGLSGAMGKKLSWMQKGTDTGPSNPFLPKPNNNAPTSKVGPSSVNGAGGSLPKNRQYGDLREDRTNGANIQLGDVISVLEHDAKENKTLQRAYHKQANAVPKR